MKEQDKLEQSIRQELTQSAEDIDVATLARIRQARARAIERNHQGASNWFGIVSGGLATACVMVFAVMIMMNNEPARTSFPAEDLEVISSIDELELYDNLEFYQWLDQYES